MHINKITDWLTETVVYIIMIYYLEFMKHSNETNFKEERCVYCLVL